LPDNGSRREEGPGVFQNGNVTLEIHADGCCFSRWKCSGPPSCISTRAPETLTSEELGARTRDLESFLRSREADEPADEPIYLTRLAELDALRIELAARETTETANA
jgi:hypothetical protein